MKSILRLSACLVAATAVLLATGCTKKPLRPNPYDTVVSQGGPDTLRPSGEIDDTIPERTTGSNADRADYTRFRPVFFDFDSAAIKVSERPKVEELANHLKSNPSTIVVLVGRCDWRGTTEYNMGLGDRRARSIRDYLSTLGVTSPGIEVISKGDLEATEGGNEGQMQQDRRVDIGILPP